MRYALVLLLAAACATTASAAATPSAPVATAKFGTLTEEDLAKAIADRPKLAKQLYDLRREALEDAILHRLVDAEAKKRGQSAEDMLHSVVEKAGAPTDAEVKKFYDEHLADSGYKLEDIRSQLKDKLAQQKRQEALVSFLDGLKAKAQVRILLEPPRVQVAAEGPSTGAADAKVTIVEFSDFQCPYCRRQEDALKKLLADYSGKVRLVYRDFPLDMHPNAAKAAQAGACAEDQGKFWQMHDKLFDNQQALSVENLKKYARDAGLDGAKFDACLDGDKDRARVQKNLTDGEKAGVDGTPALFVNGRMMSGATSYEDLRAAVDDELQRR